MAAVLLGAELGLRIFESRGHSARRIRLEHAQRGIPDETTGFFQVDPVLGYTARRASRFVHRNRGWEGVFETDDDGFRRLPHLEGRRALSPQAARRSLLLVGDSYGFGMGARDDETIDHFLLSLAPDLRLKNVSSPGWSPEQYVLAYERYREAFRPTDVFVLLCHLNDFFSLDNCTAYNRFKPTVRCEDGRPTEIVLPERMWRFKPAGESIFWESRLAFAVGQALEPAYLRSLCGVEEPHGMGRTYERDRLQIYSRALDASGKLDQLWRRFEYLVERLAAGTRAEGTHLTFVVLPLGDFAEFAGEPLARGETAADASVEVVLERVRRIAAAAGAQFLHPREAFQRAGKEAFSLEGHYGPLGNRLLAEEILAALPPPHRSAAEPSQTSPPPQEAPAQSSSSSAVGSTPQSAGPGAGGGAEPRNR